MTDPIFALPRLANLYDVFDGPRHDLDFYEVLINELAVDSVIDLGCGTGSLACRLALRGLTVIGVDPAEASLDVARTKAGAADVQWVLGSMGALPSGTVAAMVIMTGNVAQVFVDDNEWNAILRHCAAIVRPGGWLVFETRDPSQQAWTAWNRHDSFRTETIPGVGRVDCSVELTQVDLPLVSFRWSFVFHADGEVLTSDSTLRFRKQPEVRADLKQAGFELIAIRDAPDRPGKEHVYIARRMQ